MNRYVQRVRHAELADSPSDEYRFCLDALLATIADMRGTRAALGYVCGENWISAYASECVARDIRHAEERAADCAHRLFERWIEVRRDGHTCEGPGAYVPHPCMACMYEVCHQPKEST